MTPQAGGSIFQRERSKNVAKISLLSLLWLLLAAWTPCAAAIPTTHYGYKDDPFLDTASASGHGAWGQLGAGAVALTDALAHRLNVHPGDWIEMVDIYGRKHLGHYLDRAPQQAYRIDLYDPYGSEARGEPFIVAQAHKCESPYQFYPVEVETHPPIALSHLRDETANSNVERACVASGGKLKPILSKCGPELDNARIGAATFKVWSSKRGWM